MACMVDFETPICVPTVTVVVVRWWLVYFSWNIESTNRARGLRGFVHNG